MCQKDVCWNLIFKTRPSIYPLIDMANPHSPHLHQNKPDEVAWPSTEDNSRFCPDGNQGKPKDIMERLCLLAGLGTLRDSTKKGEQCGRKTLDSWLKMNNIEISANIKL